MRRAIDVVNGWGRKLSFHIAVILLMALGACPMFTKAPSLEAQMFIACASYTQALGAIVPFKDSLTVSEKATLKKTDSFLHPACETAARGGAFDLVSIRNMLRQLTALQLKKERGN